MQTTTPRRSTRISRKSFAIRPVGSYRSGYAYFWAKNALPDSQVNYHPKPKDGKGKWVIDYYSTIHRQLSASDQKETLRIGDVVLVNTRKNSYPSIGVIVAMWQARAVDGSTIHGKDGTPKIRVHWFVQPSEMAQVRAHRDHAAVCDSITSDYNKYLNSSDLLRTKFTIL